MSAAVSPAVPTSDAPPAEGGKALAGFLLSGFLLSLLGSILPAWGYYRDPPEFTAVGNYFLSLAAGLVAGGALSRPVLARRGTHFLLVFACGLAAAVLVCLGLVSPPAPAWWRDAGLFALGISAGMLHAALFHSVSGLHTRAAAAISKGGVWYGLGCIGVTLLAAGTFQTFAVSGILIAMAAVPAFFGAIYARAGSVGAHPWVHPPLSRVLQDFRSPGAVLFALLLFFQFGNEWSLAGWLPIFLIRRVGLSPKAALLTLALYWLFLTLGRLGAVAILPRFRHGRLLLWSVAAALFGCLILVSTKTGFGAVSGAFFIGAGYASVYPLVAEAVGHRFAYYHPYFCNGILSLALLGGLLAPASVGYAAEAWGVGVVVGIPLLGTCMVMLLLALIWLESKLTGR